MSDRVTPERLAVLVHEVRSPTAALLAISRTLADESVDPASRAALAGLAIDACRAIERIVLDASTASVELRAVDPGEVVSAVAAQAELAGVHVEIRVEPDLPPIAADELRMRQALGNLVTNAHVHSGTDEPIVVGARAVGRAVELFVSDVGAGIAHEDRTRILEPGVQLEPSRPGSGLGLSIVSALAEAHGGKLVVVETPGGGATFLIVVPALSGGPGS